MDPASLLIGGALVGSGWFVGRASRRSKSVSSVALNECSCGHGYGTHEDGRNCRTDVRRVRDGCTSTYEWVPCRCLTYDGPEPLPRVWTPGVES